MLLNRDRANVVMDRHGLKGLIVREKHNVYYLSDYWESLSEGGWPFAAFAVLPRDPAALPTLVIPAISLQRLDIAAPTWIENIIAFSDYSGRQTTEDSVSNAPDEPSAAPYFGWPTRKGVKLSPLAETWSQRRDAFQPKVAATPVWALRRAMKEAGLMSGRIGTDDLRLTQWLAEVGLDALEPVDAVNILREIRIVKTKAEIDIMREGARINETACLTAIDAMHEGATWPELDIVYATEIARGLDVLELLPSEFLTANEIAAAALADPGETFNPQQQFPVRWPLHPTIGLAYLDQLDRAKALSNGLSDKIRRALDRLVTTEPDQKPTLFKELSGHSAAIKASSQHRSAVKLAQLLDQLVVVN